MPVITIRGRLGSWAPDIGRMVAEKLHIDYIDRQIIAKVAARLNRDEDEILEKETPPTRLQSRISEALARGFTAGDGIQGVYLPVWQIPLDNNRYVEALSAFFNELAEGHSAVIFGRGSQYILKDHPLSLHVSIVCPLNIRLRRVMDFMKLSEGAAKQEIGRADSAMREFTRRYFGTEAEDPHHYDLVINTERYSADNAVEIVLDALRVRNLLPAPSL